MKKVIFVASSGGHLAEILTLDKIYNDYDYLLVTEKTDLTLDLKNKYNVDYLRYGPSKNIFKYIYNVIYNVIKCIKIAFKFKPDTVVSTGAQIGGIMCLICKLRGSKVIYIESIAKINTLSITGKNIYRLADKFYVQWESLAKKYDKCEYLGRLI